MTQRTGRNDLCPCGSGKKMKNCHPSGYGSKSKNRNLVIFGVVIAALLVVAVIMLRGDSNVPIQAGPARPVAPAPGTTAIPATRGGGTPQPGPAPPGKVWSPEHGHWHDLPGATDITATPGQAQPQGTGQLTPQPPGPAPEGKVWSPEHGHWHDAPAQQVQPAQPVQPTPQGSGP